MTLADQQAAFMRTILDEDAPLPQGWGNAHALGLSVYRGNYRTALMGALESSFERTARYIGKDAFRQAGINHLIANPPTHWTIDAAGEGFAQTCAGLFPSNREVAELAWLEWTMLELASAPDTACFTAADFAQASAGFGDAEWMELALTFQPRAAVQMVTHDLAALWKSLDEESDDRDLRGYDTAQGCLVWREGERPTFLMVSAENACAFAALQEGARYGDLIGLLAGEAPGEAAIQTAAQSAGAMLGQWLNEGLVIGMEAGSPDPARHS